jgi:murein L,D-transpeptidase YcbB/YkuD
MRGQWLAAALTAVLLSTSCGKLPDFRQQTQQARDAASRRALQAFLNAKQPPVFVTRDREGVRLWSLVKQFYQKREFEPGWIDGTSPRPEMDELIDVLQHADREGLDPSLYNGSTLAERRREADKGFLTKKGFNEVEAAGLDAWLTYLYMEYASDVANGLSDLSHADPNWQIPGPEFDPMATLSDALEHHTVARSLENLLPTDSQYKALRNALAQYRDIASKGGWPAIPVNLKLKPGQHHPAVPLLARRLAATGDFSGAVGDGDTEAVYGPELQEAVKRFQRRHGLEPDAVVGAAVVAQMNVPADVRVRQIELNLERWRWLPRDMGDRHIIVNIPEYQLEVSDHGRVPLAMRVVVGKKDTPTPIFADKMTYIVFAPYWNVPTDIVENETLPSVMRDPAFLEKTNMEVIDTKGNPVDPGSIDLSNPAAYRFRQRPGTSNSLGLVKFMFPNTFNVYLHDTPADSLFARATRSFSHGCVRVEQPEALAQYLLADQPSWTPEKIEEAMHGDEETIVKLRQPIPVYLGYWTARISSDGILQFSNDVYGIDGRQTQRLTDRLTRLKQHAAQAATAAISPRPATKGST